MTVSMRVMSAGDGYKYLLRTVAAGDGDRSLSTPLTRYYVEAGSPPGFWLGSGLPALSSGVIEVGDRVSEAQLELLMGMGRDPVTGDPLGHAYHRFAPVEERIAKRTADLPADLPVTERAEAVAVIEAEEQARGTRRAVAGYDFTFSVPKSVSVLWGVADAGTQALIATAHHAAVAEVVAFMEREVASTRIGANGPEGTVAHVDVEGLIATAFDHYDSRAGDPQLHTHVVISNKVRTTQDGIWRSLAGRPMHAAVVAVSEHYNAVLADHLTRTLGIGWNARERDRDRSTAWELAGVGEELIGEFSSRTRDIEAEKERLIAEYAAKHGRRPSPRTVIKLRAQATLTTRPDKEVKSLAELTAAWRDRAGRVLGEDAADWARRLTTAAERQVVLRADDVPLDVIAEVGRSVVGVVGERRSTWRRWNLHAEASRQLMGWRFATTRDREAITGLVTDAAEAASFRLTPPELASSPVLFQRADGTSRFRPRSSTVFSSELLLAAEDRLLERSRATTGPVVSLATVEKITNRPDRQGRTLGPDQAAALAAVAVSGRIVDVLVGPAGAGKTTAMSGLRRAWEAEHGPGSVIGLAPSAVAAQVLADDLDIATENTAKWWQNHLTHGETFRKGQLVIIDEASLAGTLSLDRITTLAEEAGAKVLLVGDYAQLQSVDAGGAFGLLVSDRDDAPELVDVHRFVNEWEKTASLDLRHGRVEVVDTYAEHGRIRGGDTEQMMDAAYTAWRTDTLAGKATVLIADSNETVTALNARARADLILDGTITPTREVALRDGTAASIGDTVITRRNDRRLRVGRSWVRNGDRWQVTDIRRDGSVTVRRAGTKWGAVVLPAGYVTEHLDLAYAVTAHRAQGVTTDTAHVLADSSTTRENLYVALTRGREENVVYVATDKPDDTHAEPHPGDNPEATARSVLYRVLQHVGAEPSANEAITVEQERWGSIGQLAAEYDTIAQAAQHDRWAALVRTSGLTAQDAEDAIASPAFGALTAELRRAEANHHPVDTLLPRLVAARGFADADDVAAVLHDRLARATTRPAGSGRTRKAPRLIAGLIPEAIGTMTLDMRQALTERRELIEDRADAVLDRAVRDNEKWVTGLGEPPKDAKGRTVWRRHARTVAAYRDRYGITTPTALGPTPDATAQRVDAARARAAADRARDLTRSEQERQGRRVERESLTRRL